MNQRSGQVANRNIAQHNDINNSEYFKNILDYYDIILHNINDDFFVISISF